jgi:hypothetical protein
MDNFKYEPIDLKGPAFRLLRLLKGRGFDIECELFHAWLQGDSAISYEALSYTWGDMEMSESIKLNGRELSVVKNLYLALQYLRLEDIDRILWIDAIYSYSDRSSIKHLRNLRSLIPHLEEPNEDPFRSTENPFFRRRDWPA